MHQVILRDDDTNALTPVSYLERLYRPFLDRNLPVNLATIPNVRTHVTYGDGVLEGFLVARDGVTQHSVSLAENEELVSYLKHNPGYRLAQHGYNHEFVRGDCEFEQFDRADVQRRLDDGLRIFEKAGFARPTTFVAPYDRLTPVSYREVARRFQVISTGWFELRRLPRAWWAAYALKKARKKPHWRFGSLALLSHPGCHLSYQRPVGAIVDQIRASIRQRPLTVLVTHWWEFFRDNRPDEAFIQALHETAAHLAESPDIQVVSFDDVASGKVGIG